MKVLDVENGFQCWVSGFGSGDFSTSQGLLGPCKSASCILSVCGRVEQVVVESQLPSETFSWLYFLKRRFCPDLGASQVILYRKISKDV